MSRALCSVADLDMRRPVSQHQPLSLVIVDLTHPQPFSHPASLEDQRIKGNPSGGKRNLLRH
jgi:hypothetical protein